jgi:2-phospho-L-lactate guanylyltransferase
VILRDIWAVVPIKRTGEAKQRLAEALPPELRARLALAMAEDVLAALAAAPGLAGILVVTVDDNAIALARRLGARVIADGATDGQTGAVGAAAALLGREARKAMLAIPGDVPLITPDEVQTLVAAHQRDEDFVIAPAHDGRGSNAILCAPPGRVPLAFGNDSFLPHLETARRAGVEPRVVRLAGIGLDIDNPQDLAAFLKVATRGHARAVLIDAGVNLP